MSVVGTHDLLNTIQSGGEGGGVNPGVLAIRAHACERAACLQRESRQQISGRTELQLIERRQEVSGRPIAIGANQYVVRETPLFEAVRQDSR
jgi:hypothetical protein